MIFRQEMIDKILAGEKTVTRRPVSYAYTHGAVQPKRIETPCRYKAGRTYGVQPGRGKSALARIRVVGVEKLALGVLADEEARLEGFEFSEEFELYWQLLYGEYDPTQLVHRIEFELLTSSPVKEAAR